MSDDIIQGRNGEKILLSEYPDGFTDDLNAAVVESQLEPTRWPVPRMKRPEFHTGDRVTASGIRSLITEARRTRIRQNILIGASIAMLPISCLVGLLVAGDLIPFDLR